MQFKVHRTLGVGMSEWVYREALCVELARRGVQVEREVHLDAYNEAVRRERAFRLDLLVEGCIIVEWKAVERFHTTARRRDGRDA